MYVLSRKQGQIIEVICFCKVGKSEIVKASAKIFVKKIGRSNVELGFIGPKEQILFMRGEKRDSR